jgi:uncharacterized protein
LRLLKPLVCTSLVCALLACSPANAAPVVIPEQGTYVIDKSDIIDAATEQRLEAALKSLEQKTTDQVKVLTVPTTGEEDIFTFAQRQYQLWRLGGKKKNNGALIVLAKNDRKVRIHTGYGLEGALPDSWIGEQSRRIAKQYFKAGKYAEGMEQLTLAVVHRIADEQGVKLDGLPAPARNPNATDASSLAVLVFFLIAFLFVVVVGASQRKHRNRNAWAGGFFEWYFWGSVLRDIAASSSRGRSSSSWGGGGGSGWGGGGGGGSFGGGGSSGGGGGGASW